MIKFNGIIRYLRDTVHKIKGTYLGKDGYDLYNNERTWDPKWRNISVETKNMGNLIGQIINYEPGVGFNMEAHVLRSKRTKHVSVPLEQVLSSHLAY